MIVMLMGNENNVRTLRRLLNKKRIRIDILLP